MFDVIVVGARCAGSSVARLLARQDAKVLLVDRAPILNDPLNGHYIHAARNARASALGTHRPRCQFR